MKDLRISLASARVNAKLSQRDVARVMEVSTKTIGNWERGKVIPKPAQLLMFCAVCGIDVDNILLPEKET